MNNSIVIEADNAGRYWLDIEIANIGVKTYIDTGLIGATAPSVMLTKDTWTKIESSLDSIEQLQGVDGQGKPWLIQNAISKVRVPSLGLEFDERIGSPSNVNIVGSLFLTKLKSHVIVINCERKLMTIRPLQDRTNF
ncbi:MAG: hypothetical protein PXY39_00145 [archaeon]|nr:hypothetical protein [archaeon]